jgi:hypothetical protein
MHRHTTAALFTAIALLAPLFVGCANVAEGLQRGVERAADRETARAADRATTSVVRGAENAVVCIVTDEACIERARQNGQPVEVRDRDGNVVREIPAPDGSVNTNYDFTPGHRVLFFEDYTSDPVGRFPSSFEFVRGNWEIAEWQGRRLLRHTGPHYSAFRIVLPEALPERFTIETEVYFTHRNSRIALVTQQPEGQAERVDHNYFQVGQGGTGVHAASNTGLSESANDDDRLHERLMPVRMEVDGEYVRVFVGQNRTANIPNAMLPRTEVIYVENINFADEEHPMYLGPIRVATD